MWRVIVAAHRPLHLHIKDKSIVPCFSSAFLYPVFASFAVAPLVFKREDVGGMPMMVASLQLRNDVHAPIFLTIEEYRGLVRFLNEEPTWRHPQLLLLVAAIKSGKSTLLMEVIEGLVTALRMDDARMLARPPPVFFKFAFDQRCDVEVAARDLASALRDFAHSLGVHLQPRESQPIDHFAAVAAELSEAIHRSGRELWLLIDEAQGPIVGSTLGDSDVFVSKFKRVRTEIVSVCEVSQFRRPLPAHMLPFHARLFLPAARREVLTIWAHHCNRQRDGSPAGRSSQAATQ
jgi:hypothetical protein